MHSVISSYFYSEWIQIIHPALWWPRKMRSCFPRPFTSFQSRIGKKKNLEAPAKSSSNSANLGVSAKYYKKRMKMNLKMKMIVGKNFTIFRAIKYVNLIPMMICSWMRRLMRFASLKTKRMIYLVSRCRLPSRTNNSDRRSKILPHQ